MLLNHMCTVDQGLMAGKPFGGVAGWALPKETKRLNQSMQNPVGGVASLLAPKTAKKANKTIKKISDFQSPTSGGVAHLS